MFEDEVDSDSSSSESEGDGRRELKGRARWLKKAPADATKKKEEVVVKKDRVVTKKKDYGEGASNAKRIAASLLNEVKLTEEELDKKVVELMATRGRKNTDPREVLRQLEVLTKAARLHGPRKEVPVLMHLISNMLDSQRSIDDYLEHNQWRTCYRSLYRVVTLMEANKKLSLGTIAGDEATDISNSTLMKVAEVAAPATAVDPSVIKVVGSMESFIIRLQDEYTKSLQQINPHTKVKNENSVHSYICCVS